MLGIYCTLCILTVYTSTVRVYVLVLLNSMHARVCLVQYKFTKITVHVYTRTRTRTCHRTVHVRV